MKIDLHRMTVRNVINDYKDSDELGVTAYEGKLTSGQNTSVNLYITISSEKM